MSNPEMKGARILRFHTSDKVFHSINAICWYALVITGAIVYFGHWMGDISDETANLMMVCTSGWVLSSPLTSWAMFSSLPNVLP